jgi:hypothetical protein
MRFSVAVVGFVLFGSMTSCSNTRPTGNSGARTKPQLAWVLDAETKALLALMAMQAAPMQDEPSRRAVAMRPVTSLDSHRVYYAALDKHLTHSDRAEILRQLHEVSSMIYDHEAGLVAGGVDMQAGSGYLYAARVIEQRSGFVRIGGGAFISSDAGVSYNLTFVEEDGHAVLVTVETTAIY